jgi:hypothetical protein
MVNIMQTEFYMVENCRWTTEVINDHVALEQRVQEGLQVALEPTLAQVLCNQRQLPPCCLLQQVDHQHCLPLKLSEVPGSHKQDGPDPACWSAPSQRS